MDRLALFRHGAALARRSIVSLFLLCMLVGCSGASATVSGKVTALGAPVTQGTIVFAPVETEENRTPGKSALAPIQADGSYSLEIKAGPQGLAERCRLHFTPPRVDVTAESKDVAVPYDRYRPKEETVAIKPGVNVIDIELISPPQQ